MPQPAAVEELSADLLAVYADVWARVEAEQEQLLHAWPSLTRPQRLARIRALRELVTGLMATADEQALRYSAEQLPRAFLYGAIATTTAAAGGQLEGLSLDALAHLAGDSYRDLLQATQGVRDTTKALIRTLAREHVSDLLVRGETAVQAGRDLAGALAEHGISAVTYANGARHGLADYTDMLLRTKSALAYNEGGFAGLTAGGVAYVEVLDGHKCGWTSHNDTDKANGTVRTLEQAQQWPVSHPRCRRAFAGRPEVTSAAQARRAAPTVTRAQQIDQSAAEDSRELQMARRAAARALSGQVDRKTARLLEAGAGRTVSPAHARRIASRQVRTARAARLEARRARLAQRAASRGTRDSG